MGHPELSGFPLPSGIIPRGDSPLPVGLILGYLKFKTSLEKWAHLPQLQVYTVQSHILQRKKSISIFPSLAGMSLTKLSLGRNNLYMTSLFPPRESLVGKSHPGWGREYRKAFFTVYRTVQFSFQLTESYFSGFASSINIQLICKVHEVVNCNKQSFANFLLLLKSLKPISLDRPLLCHCTIQLHYEQATSLS